MLDAHKERKKEKEIKITERLKTFNPQTTLRLYLSVVYLVRFSRTFKIISRLRTIITFRRVDRIITINETMS